MMRLLRIAILLAAFSQAYAASLRVSTGIAPIGNLLSRVGGTRVEVSVLLPPGASPHSWEPKPKALAQLSQSAAYLSIGAAFEEAWIPRFRSVRSGLAVIALDSGVVRIPMVDEDEEDNHSHSHGHEHEAGMDPHLWTSPVRMRQVAINAASALSRLDPAGAALYRENLSHLLKSLDSLDAAVRNRLAKLPSDERAFLVYHPSYGYFAQDYGLEQIAVEMEGKEPSPAELRHLVDLARKRKVRAVLLQPELPIRSAEAVAREIGVPVLRLNPLAADWLSQAVQLCDAIVQGR